MRRGSELGLMLEIGEVNKYVSTCGYLAGSN